jgi:hypothetical protein
MCAAAICNILILFQFLNLVFMMKERYSHLNKHLTNWINGTVSRSKIFMNKNETSIQSDMAVGHINITCLCISSLGGIDGTLTQTDIHLLRQM